MSKPSQWALLLVAIVLAGCVLKTSGSVKPLDNDDGWAILPLANESESLTAVQSATSLVGENLRRRGVSAQLVSGQPNSAEPNRYLVTGRVIDWRYKTISRPKPYVNLALHVYDVETQQLVWRGEKSGSGRQGRSVVSVANDVLSDLVSNISVTNNRESKFTHDDSAILAAVTELTHTSSKSADSSSDAIASSVSLRVNDASGQADWSDISDETKQLPVSQYAPGGSIALYYATKPPVRMLNEFDRVVLEPDAVTPQELSSFNVNSGTKSSLYAYLSVGEVGPSRSWLSEIDSAWNLGVNEAWNSRVMDLSNPGWRAFLMRRASALLRKGYNGLFLDTMDSYQLFAKTAEARESQQQGLITFIASLKAKHPEVKLIANRGFELLPSIAQHLEVVAAESLYGRWHGGSGGYQDVPSNDRQWLLGQLNTAKSKYGLEVLSIDYVEPSERNRARQIANKIASHGVIPWVSTPGLDQMGVGLEEVYPREVLLLFDSTIDGLMHDALIHRMVATPLEYFGYVPKYIDVANDALPTGNLSGEYAGVVVWTEGRIKLDNWSQWLLAQKNSGVPLLLLGNVGAGVDASVLNSFGMDSVSFTGGAVSTDKKSPWIGFEREPAPRIDYLNGAVTSRNPDHQVHLSYVDSRGTEVDAVAVTPWGGYAVNAGLFESDPDRNVFWIVDPFKFIRTALRLPDIPQPDVTTQTGRRVVTAHIDGDALPSWAEMPGRRLGAEVLYEDIIKPYKIPHTISIVEAEMVGFPQFFDRRKRMFDVMRAMFREDHVELATHTYSHPFKWNLIAPNAESGKYNLRLPGYKFSYEREFDGSVDFINNQLAPDDKRVEVVLWSGDAIPKKAALAQVEKLGLLNLNGGKTTISKAYPGLERVSPMVRTVGEYEQIYAPIMNENVYTNDWTGPFDGFRRVIETFELTDKPRRLKPMGIYYHFYSGTKISGMRAMKEIYDYTLKQDIAPVYISSYAKRVKEFRKAQVSKSVNEFWSVSGLDEAQSIRLFDRTRQVELSSSDGVAGQRRLHDALYIHPTSDGVAKFRLSEAQSRVPELVSSNGQITAWERTGRTVSFRIQADVPVSITLKNANGCRLSGRQGTVSGKQTNSGLNFNFTQKDTGNVSLQCPA